MKRVCATGEFCGEIRSMESSYYEKFVQQATTLFLFNSPLNQHAASKITITCTLFLKQ